MREDLPDGEVSLLLTDIEGSTRLLHRLGAERYADALADHRALLREAFFSNGGVEVDNQGDAFFIAFPSVEQCFLGAVAGHRALAAHRWFQDRPVRVRMGMHTGEPTRTAEGYVGEDVHEAARIAAAGHGGQLLLSQRCAEQLTDLISNSDLGLRDLGEHTLKDIDGPRRLFQAMVPDLPSDFPELSTQQTRPNNLPTAPTPFVGRQEHVADVVDLMLQPDVRLITLTGPGGTGKSRLGLRVAGELLSRFSAGAFFVPLAAVMDPKLVTSEIASALGVKEGQTALEETLAENIDDKDLLLLIDNFEQVQSADGQIAKLLARCPRLKVLVTSREALRVSGGRGYPVPPLELPEPGRLPPVDTVARFEAIRLFVDRARAVRSEFELTEDNVEDVVEICRRVDGLPLALELAASRIKTLQPDRLARALDKRLKVLKGGAADLLDHQKTLRDLIAWSYDMLEEDEQVLWRRLAVFVGGATFEAAQAVCDVDDEFDVELDIESLVDKSLVNLHFTGGSGVDKVISGGASEGPRLMLLETLREFAFDALKDSGEADELLDRHNDWFLDFVEQAEKELRGEDQNRWLDRLDQDHGNIRAAMARALYEDRERAQRFGAALWFFWFHHGYMSEGRALLEHSLEDDDGTSHLCARALMGLANLDRHQNLPEDAQANGEKALGIFRALDDREGIADALGQLGAIAQHQGDLDRSAELLTEAVTLLREVDNRERLSFTLNVLGSFELLKGHLDEAARLYEESRTLGQELHDHAKVAHASVNLGEVKQMQGDLDGARTLYRDCVALYHHSGMKMALAYSMEILAGLETDLGQPEIAARLLGAADAIRVEIASPIEPFNKERYDNDIERTRAALGPEKYETLSAEARRDKLANTLSHIR